MKICHRNCLCIADQHYECLHFALKKSSTAFHMRLNTKSGWGLSAYSLESPFALPLMVLADWPCARHRVLYTYFMSLPPNSLDLELMNAEQVSLDLSVDGQPIGNVVIQVFQDPPLGTQRFLDLAKRRAGGYRLSRVDGISDVSSSCPHHKTNWLMGQGLDAKDHI